LGLENIKTFAECIAIAGEKVSKHLMLGNGFSISLRPDIFNYKKLAEKLSNPMVQGLLNKLGTNDFEFLMRRLFETAEIAKHYEDEPANTSIPISQKITEHLEYLKKALIEVIARSHPSSSSFITVEQYQSCQKFLKHFNLGKKYSLNYDLLLYWVCVKFMDEGNDHLSSKDGFLPNKNYPENKVNVLAETKNKSRKPKSPLHWEITQAENQDLYYLHGAMHLFTDGTNLEKLRYDSSEGSIADQVKKLIEKNKYPLFISEGSSVHKMGRIKSSGYLTRALTSLQQIEGSLFIFGHSLRDEDDHVLDVIHQNEKLKKVFVSFYGDISSGENKHLKNKAEEWAKKFKNQKEYFLYQAESAKVWDNPDVLITKENVGK